MIIPNEELREVFMNKLILAYKSVYHFLEDNLDESVKKF